MSNMTLETDHFYIEHAHWNAGTRWPEWTIQQKRDKTAEITAMVPPLASSYCGPEDLVPFMHEAEAWYIRNRMSLERNRGITKNALTAQLEERNEIHA